MKNINLTVSLKSMHYGTTLHPSRDWLVLLVLTLVLILISVAWNLWMFSKVTEGEPIGAATAPQTTDTATLDAVTKLFEERAAEEARYRSEYQFVDPSSPAR